MDVISVLAESKWRSDHTIFLSHSNHMIRNFMNFSLITFHLIGTIQTNIFIFVSPTHHGRITIYHPTETINRPHHFHNTIIAERLSSIINLQLCNNYHWMMKFKLILEWNEWSWLILTTQFWRVELLNLDLSEVSFQNFRHCNCWIIVV